jgi:hypothetical protein
MSLSRFGEGGFFFGGIQGRNGFVRDWPWPSGTITKAIRRAGENSMIFLGFILAAAGSAAVPAYPETNPRGNPADWIRSSDFSADALRERAADVVRFRLIVNASGALDDCLIVVSSGSTKLDKEVCQQLMQNGRFAPVEEAGKGARLRQWTSNIRIASSIVANPTVETGLNYDAEFEYRVDRDGKAITCRSIRATNIAPVNCSDAIGKRVMTPPARGDFKGGVMTIRTTRTFQPD